MELEISKTVLSDIATAAVEQLEGIEIAPATSLDTARDTAAAISGLTPSSLNPSTITSNIKGNLNAEALTTLPRRRALKITRDGSQVSLDVGVNVEYGRNILELANKARLAMAENIELMTGLKVREVNVVVQSLSLPGTQQGGQA